MTDVLDPTPKRAKPTRGDWIRYVILVVTWGSAFSLSKVAVMEMPASVVTAGRIWVGVFLLFGWMIYRKHKLPPLLPRPDIRWAWFVPVGITGAALPFLLNAWALQSLDSGLTSILLATMPLSVAFLSHFTISGDHMTLNKVLGLLFGLTGIVILVGPDSLSALGGPTVLAQFMVLGAAALYAINAVLIHFMPETSPSVAATGMLLTAGIVLLPFAIWDAMHMQMPSLQMMMVVGLLGFGATGFGSILYMQVIRSAGPNFIATTNYFVPPFAVLIGAIWLGERLSVWAILALLVILAGLFLERKNL